MAIDMVMIGSDWKIESQKAWIPHQFDGARNFT